MSRLNWPRRLSGSLVTVGLAYLTIGLSLLLTPVRWSQGGSSGILLDITKASWWGLTYLVVAALLGAVAWWPARRWVAVTAFTVSIALNSVWLLGFTFRYFLDGRLNPIALIAWAVFLSLLIRSALALDDDQAVPVSPPDVEKR